MDIFSKISIFYFSFFFFFFFNKTLKIKIYNSLLSFFSIIRRESKFHSSNGSFTTNFSCFIKFLPLYKTLLSIFFFFFFKKLQFLFFVFLSFHLSAYVAARVPLFYSLTMKFAALTEHIFLIHKKIINNAYCNLVDPFIIQRKTSLSLSLSLSYSLIMIRTRPFKPFIPRVVR